MRRLPKPKLGPRLRAALLPVAPAVWCQVLLLLRPPSGPQLVAPAADAKLETSLDVEAGVETGKVGNPAAAAAGEHLPEDAVLEGEGSWTPKRLACCE